MRDPLTRRHFLRGMCGLGALVLASGCPTPPRHQIPRDARGRPMPTPAIDDGDDDMPAARVCAATADNIEGPYYKPGAPHRATLVGASDKGERLALGGTILGLDCQPVAAELDIWHADAAGGYDMAGFKFRATLTVAADGQWHVDTIVPGRYLNGDRYRPAHIHAKLRAPGHRDLTTQLYFAGDPYNDGDHWIVPSLIMPTTVDGGVRQARFDFVLEAA